MALPELYGCYSGTVLDGTPRTLRLFTQVLRLLALPELYGCYSGTAPVGTPRTLRLLLRYCA